MLEVLAKVLFISQHDQETSLSSTSQNTPQNVNAKYKGCLGMQKREKYLNPIWNDIFYSSNIVLLLKGKITVN